MGGMITQTVGYRHPDRVRSLVSVMSGTGNPDLPGPSDAVRTSFLTPTEAVWRDDLSSIDTKSYYQVRITFEDSCERDRHVLAAERRLAGQHLKK